MIKGHSLDTGEGLVVWLTRSFRNFVSTPLEREYWGLMNEEALVVPHACSIPGLGIQTVLGLLHNLLLPWPATSFIDEQLYGPVYSWIGLPSPPSPGSWLNKPVDIVVPIVETEFKLDEPKEPSGRNIVGPAMGMTASKLRMSTWTKATLSIHDVDLGLDLVLECLKDYYKMGVRYESSPALH